MNSKIISIIGGGGAAGEVVTRLLCENTENEIIIADINFEKAKSLADQQRINVRPIRLDVFDETQVRNLCQKSDIIVNCAGPTVKILYTVGKIAMQEECDYIEIGGYDYTDEEMRNEINKHSNLSYITSSGCVPGISDYLVYYTDLRADELFDKKENLTYFFGGRYSGATYSGLLDTVRLTKKIVSRSVSIAKAGKLRKAINFTKVYNLSFGLKKQRGFINMTPELEAFALSHKEYSRIQGYLILFGWKTYFTFMRIAFFLYTDEKCIKALDNAYKSELEKNEKRGAAIVEITGLKDGKRIKLCTYIDTTEAYFLTGAGCAATVMLLLKQKVRKGFGYMSESVDIPEYATVLNRLGVKISENLYDISSFRQGGSTL